MNPCVGLIRKASLFFSVAALLQSGHVLAASGTWLGAHDAVWTNGDNWTASPYAGSALTDAATFNNAGGGNVAINLQGIGSLSSITFDTANVASYTLGTGIADSQTLVLANNGLIQLSAIAGSDQAFNCGVQLGHMTNGASFTFRNDNPARTLTFSKVFIPSAGPINTRTLTIDGGGATRILGDLQKGAASSFTLNYNGSGPLTLAGNNTLTQLNINGDPASAINLAEGSVTTFSNGGAGNIVAARNCTINGPGVMVLSTSGGEGYADNGVAGGKTLTINAKLTGNTGFEYYHGTYYGTIALNGANDFTGQVLINNPGTISVNKMGNRGATDSGLGAGSYMRFSADGAGARLLYTGAGETSDRYFHFKKNLSIIEQGGSGVLTLTSTNICDSGAKTLQLQGSTDGIGEFAAALVNSAGTLTLVKAGSGTWRLSAACTYSGTTTVNGGTLTLTGADGAAVFSTGYTLAPSGTLLLDNTAAANNTNRLRDASALTFTGGTLALSNDGGSADFAENAGAISVTQGANTISAAPATASQKSTLRFASLARTGGTLDFVGEGLGTSDQNRIFITGQADGLIGTWATVNGTSYAAYSSANGVYASALTVVNVAAQGTDPDSVIPDNASADVHITTAGSSGSDTLAGASVNSIFSLQQDSGTPSTLTTAAKTLKAAKITVSSGAANLTIGDAPGDGVLAPLAAGGVLALRNDEATSVLTVNAPVANNTSASALYTYGIGKTLLTAANTYSGATMINGGTLAFGGTSTQTLAGVIGGIGTLAKEGTGRLTLSGANTYTGVTVVSSGTLVAQNSSALGAKTEGTVVENGATLDLGGTLGANALSLDAETVTVGGAGVDGRGAIINASANSQYNALTLLSLADDTTFGGENSAARWDVRTTGSSLRAFLYMNGHNITKVGSNYVGLTGVTVLPGAGNIDIREGYFTAEVGTDFGGSSANTMTVQGGAVFDCYQLYTPVLWSLVMKDNARFYVRYQMNNYQNVWAGPVTLDGRAVFDTANGFATLAGDIGGGGSLVKINGNTLRLLGNNSYAGTTTVSNGTLYALTPASLPGYNDGRLTLVGGATLATHAAAGGIGWTAENIRDMHNASTFTANSAVINVDTTYAPLEYPYALSKPVTLTKQGDTTLTVSGPFTTESPLRVNAGEVLFNGETDHLPGTIYTWTANLTLSDSAFVYVKSNSCYIADGSTYVSRMTVKDHAGFSGFLYPYNVGQSTLVIGQSGRGILTIQDDACVTQKLYVGNNAGSAGAVYQNGGTMFNWGGAASDGRIGEAGYGYYELNSGTFTNNGYFQIGRQASGVGILKQTNGKFEMGTVYNGQLGISRSGTGVVYLAGGTFATGPSPVQANPTVDIGNSSDYSSNKGFAEFTVDGTADAYVAGYMSMANRSNMFATVNLNGGLLTANYFTRGTYQNSIALVNFDGGTFRARQSGELFYGGANAVNAINIYEGGAVIDTTNLTCAISLPLRAPVGKGVSGLYVPPTPGYIGPPMVTLAGGDGTGATAIATFDSASGTLTGIQMTCPGYGYTVAPTVSLSGGGSNAFPTVTGLTLVPNTSGGLTKLGSGTLTLNSTNTYGGVTKVMEGTLKAGQASAIPPTSQLYAAGGILDLGGFVTTNGGVTITDGLIANGTLACDSVTKAGNTASVLGVPIVTPSTLAVSNGTLIVRRAGLWEGPIWGNFQTTSNNPATAVQLSTRMANTTANWPTNTTYMYSGTIWNRSDSQVTWTFAENFDDNVYLKIDSTVMMTNGITWNAPTLSSIALDPGPHPFEVRFGQGTGGAGPVNSSWWKTTAFGFGIDYQGRNDTNITYYVPLVDPGDGSLLTLDGAGLTNPLDAATVAQIAAGATLDLDQSVQTLAGLSGSGTVSNGQLTVTGDIAPGGTGTVGTLTVASSLTATGRLLIDVAGDGNNGDFLAVTGDINLSSLDLEISNPEALDRTKAYTILSYTGTRFGTLFASVANLPDSRWHVTYRSDGTVKLIFVNGTLIELF